MITFLVIVGIIIFFVMVFFAFCAGEAYGTLQTERRWTEAVAKGNTHREILSNTLDAIDPDRFKTRFANKGYPSQTSATGKVLK